MKREELEFKSTRCQNQTDAYEEKRIVNIKVIVETSDDEEVELKDILLMLTSHLRNAKISRFSEILSKDALCYCWLSEICDIFQWIIYR